MDNEADFEKSLEESLDASVAVERPTSEPGQRAGSSTVTIRCDPEDVERLRDELAAVEAEFAFETRR
jgi:hypothetical protein